MTATVDMHPWRLLRHNPLVPVAALFLSGVALGQWSVVPAGTVLTLALIFWTAWLIGEWSLPPTARTRFAHGFLSLAILFAGASVWQLNQQQAENTHLARFAPAAGEIPITLRARVLVAPPPNRDHRGNSYFTADAAELFTMQGWLPAFGTAQVKWRASPVAPELHRGDRVELYGWLSRPAAALNPGGLDLRQRLAADRIFVQIRVPRTMGVRILERSGEDGSPLLTRLRLFLRGKLLEHTANIDSDAANTMVALLLGRRDPSIDDISQAFADAGGVAHLLAISGAHIVFLAAVVWLLLRFVPIRPQWREPLCAALVIGYVLATPCGPPVVRAAIVLSMVVMSRLLRRPPTYLNMLAAAAIGIVLLRPADLFNAGFQLTFVCTAALILLAQRLHAFLFTHFLERAQLIADLRDTFHARVTLRAQKVLAALITANLIGAFTAAPLVAYHFNQFTPYGVFTGLLAFPAVALTMIASLAQLFLELVSTSAAGMFAPVSTAAAQVAVWLVERLAALPGAAIPLRAPPALIVAVLYVPVLLWTGRRRLSLSRAFIVNGFLASWTIAVGWYAIMQPVGTLTLQALSVGQGSSVAMTTPAGDTVLINADSRDMPDILQNAIVPALRVRGTRHLRALVLTELDAVHAQNAGEVVSRYRPSGLFTPPEESTVTFAAMSLSSAADAGSIPRFSLRAGDCLDLGRSAVATILWPPKADGPTADLVIMLEYAGRRVLLLDPANVPALALLQIDGVDLRSDAVMLLGPQRGVGDAELRTLLQDTEAETIIWSGRGAWAPRVALPGDLNSADGTVSLTIDAAGQMNIHR